MERNSVHPADAAAKLPVRQKEVKFDSLCVSADDRYPEGTTAKLEERRGFRPNTKLYTTNVARARGRASGGTVDFTESLPILNEVLGEERASHAGRPRARQMRASEGNVDATPIARIRPKGSVARPLPAAAAAAANPSTRTLWVEGSSVLNQDVGLASAALTHLSDCVAQERRLKEEWEAARLAKVRALRAVVKVFMQSFTDHGTYARSTSISGKVLSDTLAVARCSVVTNALVGTVQVFLRAFRSRQLCAATASTSGAHPLPNVGRQGSAGLAMSFYSSGPGGTALSVDDSYASPSHSASDCLEEDEVSRLKQLYFDYFDCEAVSISSAAPSCSDTSLLAYGVPPTTSRPASSVSRSDQSSFSQYASKTM
ncbi:hypothetical protein NESM_000153200 [Novymonas esmeraldas]|uniref:Uncharacterized protein n=1 Tax=Novymonas esmeraldas TaxID=1808958 RepID=A0AAW0F2Z6_9TRYP